MFVAGVALGGVGRFGVGVVGGVIVGFEPEKLLFWVTKARAITPMAKLKEIVKKAEVGGFID